MFSKVAFVNDEGSARLLNGHGRSRLRSHKGRSIDDAVILWIIVYASLHVRQGYHPWLLLLVHMCNNTTVIEKILIQGVISARLETYVGREKP
jgi:hypothetical protein